MTKHTVFNDAYKDQVLDLKLRQVDYITSFFSDYLHNSTLVIHNPNLFRKVINGLRDFSPKTQTQIEFNRYCLYDNRPSLLNTLKNHLAREEWNQFKQILVGNFKSSEFNKMSPNVAQAYIDLKNIVVRNDSFYGEFLLKGIQKICTPLSNRTIDAKLIASDESYRLALWNDYTSKLTDCCFKYSDKLKQMRACPNDVFPGVPANSIIEIVTKYEYLFKLFFRSFTESSPNRSTNF